MGGEGRLGTISWVNRNRPVARVAIQCAKYTGIPERVYKLIHARKGIEVPYREGI
jgi:hypothetical protein